jgi:hypothetical protein
MTRLLIASAIALLSNVVISLLIFTTVSIYQPTGVIAFYVLYYVDIISISFTQILAFQTPSKKTSSSSSNQSANNTIGKSPASHDSVPEPGFTEMELTNIALPP